MAYLFAFDFDGNAMAPTPSPTGMSVKQACLQMISEMFGSPGIARYEAIGGLSNRAPSELVYELLKEDLDGQLVQSAQNYFEREYTSLGSYVPEGKGVPLIWNDENPTPVISELLVRGKLHILSDCIGTYEDGFIWPQPVNGFIEFWNYLNEVKEALHINTAIISSGHDLFIQKTFDLWQLRYPDVFSTEDDITGRKNPVEMERRVKPGELPLALARFQWLRQRGLSSLRYETLTQAINDKPNMMYFGDDQNKDGKLAQNARIPFGWCTSEFDAETSLQTNVLVFSDWRQVQEILENNYTNLKDGGSVNEIFFPGTISIGEGRRYAHSKETY